ncbi:MAG: ABC transporter ATP-binding protein [Anaerolineales bacterium]|nr:ABC transporter ATP-binding protein [Anaerolineales bacterium]
MNSVQGLELKNVQKTFGNTQAVSGVSFKVQKGEIVGLLGPSGSGKTTLLEIIAGLIQPDRGVCTWDGEDLADIPTHKRGFGLMFQDFALFPHKNVHENVSFGLLMQDWSSARVSQRVEEVLDLVGLPGFGSREVDTLSGGEKQRVALARSFAPQPRLLMLDEPIGSLDRTLRERLMGEVREILKSMKQTAIYVTHDQKEAFTVADRIVVLQEGTVAQIGTPLEIYHHPDTPFIAQFLGLRNVFPAEIKKVDGQMVISSPFGEWPSQEDRERKVSLLLRPDAVMLGPSPDANHCELRGTLMKKSFTGKAYQAEVDAEGTRLHFTFSSSAEDFPPQGQEITLHFHPSKAFQVFE